MVKEMKLKSRLDNHELLVLMSVKKDCAGIVSNPLCWLEFVDNNHLPTGCNRCRFCALNHFVCDNFNCTNREDGREGIWIFHGPGIDD